MKKLMLLLLCCPVLVFCQEKIENDNNSKKKSSFNFSKSNKYQPFQAKKNKQDLGNLNQVSSKGNWSSIDKARFRSELEMAGDLDIFGEYKSEFIECSLNKCEEKYTSYNAFLNDYEDLAYKVGEECAAELFFRGSSESVKGNWSNLDKIMFRLGLSETEDIDAFGGYQSEFIECALNKCEDNYFSYMDALTDQDGLESIGAECGELIYQIYFE